MKTAELLVYLRELDIRLWLEGDRLHYSAPSGALTPVLRAKIAEHKSKIVLLLRKAQVSPHSFSLATHPRASEVTLSFAQQQLWFLDQLEPDSTAYNLIEIARITGPLQVDKLKQTLQELVRRHEILRTTFATIQEQPVKVINPPTPLLLPLLDLCMLSSEEATASIQQLASQALSQPFNLAEGPLIRMTLLRLAAEEHVLLLTIHHIIYDGWSTEVFLRELATLYTAFIQAQPSPLPELPIQYPNFTLWQRQWLQGEVLTKQVEYWKLQSAGAPITAFFQESTIEHLTSILHTREISSLQSPLVAIQPKGSGRPLFCIHPGGGEVVCYVPLAHYIGANHPLYGLKSLGLYGEQEPLTRIEEMAAIYLNAIRTIQPQGPYYLGGWSFGGIVAFEMAQQLFREKHEVALLVMLDAYLLDLSEKEYANYDDASVVGELVRSLADNEESISAHLLPGDILKQMSSDELYNYLLSIMKSINLMPPDANLQMVRYHLRVFKNNILAHWMYKPQKYPGRITLFEASKKIDLDQTPILPWNSISAVPVEVYKIPCTHMQLLKEPHVRILAELLRACLVSGAK